MTRLRVAAAQINVTVGRPGRQRRADPGRHRGRRGRRRRPRRLPRAGHHRLPARGPPAAARPSWPRPSEALEKIAARTGQTVAVIGFPLAERDLYNAAAVCAGGSVRGVYRKWLLPNYGVFDEARYFTPERRPRLPVRRQRRPGGGVDLRGRRGRPTGPIAAQAAGGAELAVNINASPVLRRPHRRAGDDAGHPGRRPLRPHPLREPGRRAGRARLRRRLGDLRRVRPPPGPGPAVRGGPPRRRPRRAPHLPQAAPRPPGPGQPPAAARGPHLRGPRQRPSRPAPARVETAARRRGRGVVGAA